MRRGMLFSLALLVGAYLISVLCTGAMAQSPGEIVGHTLYYNQTNGSTGQRIALDSQGGIHCAWIRLSSGPSAAAAYYNYRDPNGGWEWPDLGIAISDGSSYRFPQISIYPNDRAAIVCHRAGISDSVFLAIDGFNGLGSFSLHIVPNLIGNDDFMWPYMAIDRNNNIHIVATKASEFPVNPRTIGYTRSTNGGSVWTDFQAIDTLTTISAIVVSSPVSDKVAIIYAHPTVLTSQRENDIFYIQSLDGTTWDFEGGKVNVTNYGQPENSLYAYTDLDAVYDYNDDLHITWNAQWVRGDTILGNRAFLFHYDVASGIISEITHVDVPRIVSCDFGGWNLAVNKMSLGVNQFTGAIYAAYTRFDTSDCSAGGTANGEIYLQYSSDNGSNWSVPENLTNSHTPGCQAGDCASDEWPSMAKKVDDNAHIFYISITGGSTITDNPMLYLRYPIPLTQLSDDKPTPGSFTISQNYPNPFNAATTISFTLEKEAYIKLTVYGVTGAKIATLADGRMNAGRHDIGWNASDFSSGIYYYRLTSGKDYLIKKMLVLK